MLDAIGYNVTPEPASIALVATALGLLTGIRRRPERLIFRRQ